jgi:hypothetical protein
MRWSISKLTIGVEFGGRDVQLVGGLPVVEFGR